MKPERIAQVVAAAAFLLHMAVAGRYDFFRDELYFIACGRHPAFGYADQPPLVPLLAAATQAFGPHLVLLRLVPAATAAAIVLVTAALARRAGAGPYGVALAATASAIAPIYLGLTTLLNTSMLEPIAWTLVALLVARAVLDGEARAWILAGLVVGLALEAKYAIPTYLVPLGLALVLTGHARALARRELAAGIAFALLLAAPSLVWQHTHGLPFRDPAATDSSPRRGRLSGPAAQVRPGCFGEVQQRGLQKPPGHVRASGVRGAISAPSRDRYAARFDVASFVSGAGSGTGAGLSRPSTVM